MRRSVLVGMAVLSLALAGAAQADVLFDFETGVQGWYRFGGGTLHFGPAAGEGSSGDGIVYVTNLNESLWGGAVKSPDLPGVGIDMSQYTAFSADVQLSNDALDPVYPGPGPNVELMLNLPGYLEWTASYSLPVDGQYYTLSSTYADLVPSNAATAPITLAQLQDPSLEIRVLLRNTQRDAGAPSGKIRLRVDNVQAVPEPVAGLLLAVGGFALLRRGRSR